ncbi:feruloyl esterase [Verrucomicrobium sp. GAS474]|uniref:tannase/feruloyl esterase family alpha/beta hydrolase n=1 Tax=Verrucomicrobium sp. GAS474 TaxID=1882831 RepID=UPI00087CDF92|nr:tannase/feruloyl esterase family alpha/beta hydrolase [Verrucomicrobium sp. GAS474]SDU10041.1 feruloyl esterase [Verrucomicrobium sp. GAS474]
MLVASLSFLPCLPMFSQESPGNASAAPAPSDDEALLAPIRALKIEGAITQLTHDVSPTMTTPDGKIHDHLVPRTIVNLVLTPAPGSHINVELWLPDAAKWNGILVGNGNGGAAGNINPMSLAWGPGQGYAMVTTDMGTAPNSDSGVGNPEVWKDFGFRATHLMTVVAKQIVAAYYGKGPTYSYFVGGSTGGQQGLQEAQRYPEDYDGIVANVPAHCRTPLHAYFLWNYQILHKCPFTESQEKSVVAAGNEYMAPREAPAVAGKFVSDPRGDAKDTEAVIALALKNDPTLTPAHAEALRKLFAGPTNSLTGERIFDGLPIGASFAGATGNLYLFKWALGAKKPLEEIDFGHDFDTYTRLLGPYLNAENPDLSRFEARGGKLVMMAGSFDACVPYHVSIDYYERVIERLGGLEKVQSFFKFYLIPGMGHSGGPGIQQAPNMLEALRAWREKGTAPEALRGVRQEEGKTVLELPLYPYPRKAAWDAASASFKPVEGPRGGVGRVSDAALPPAAE